MFRSEFFFSDNTRVRIFIFLSRNFFFQNSTLGYMTKNSESHYFFFLHQNQNIFLEKNHNPPFKLNGRSLNNRTYITCRRKYNYCPNAYLKQYILRMRYTRGANNWTIISNIQKQRKQKRCHQLSRNNSSACN